MKLYLIFCRNLKKHLAQYQLYKTSKVCNTDTAQPSAISFGDFSARTVYGRNRPEQLRKTKSLIGNLLIDCYILISIVENDSFIQFLNDFDPKYEAPSRQHISETLIPNLREKKCCYS